MNSLSRLLSAVCVGGTGLVFGYWLAPSPQPAVPTLNRSFLVPAVDMPAIQSPARETNRPEERIESAPELSRSVDEIFADLMQLNEDHQKTGEIQWIKYSRAKRHLLRNLPADTLRELTQRFLQLNAKKQPPYIIQDLLSRLAEKDPAATLQFLQHPLSGLPPWSQGQLLGKIYQNNPTEILALLKSPALSRDQQLLSSFFAALTLDNPQTALRLVKTDFKNQQASSMQSTIVAAWSQKDPAAAAAYALQISEGRFRRNALSSVAYSWSARDRLGALAWAEALPQGLDRQTALGATLNQWAQQDVSAALAYFQKMPDNPEKWKMFGPLSYSFARANPEALLPLIESMPLGSEKIQAVYALSNRWIQTDPEKAIDFLSHQAPSSNTIPLLQQGLNSWIQKNPEAALEYAVALDPAQRYKVLPGLMEQAAEKAPEAAFKAALATYNEAALGQLSKKIASTNPQQALNLASRVPAGKLQDTIVGQALGMWGQNDPVSAGNYALNLSAETLSRSIDLLAPSLSEKNPAYAKEWALKIPAQNAAAREQAVYQVASSLAKRNWTEADTWRQTLPAGNLRDQATMAQSYPMAEKQPAAALNLVMTMANPENRDNTARKLFNQWKARDLTAASQWMQNTRLPETLKKQLGPL
jgi:hypothetical protein